MHRRRSRGLSTHAREPPNARIELRASEQHARGARAIPSSARVFQRTLSRGRHEWLSERAEPIGVDFYLLDLLGADPQRELLELVREKIAID